MSDYFEAAASVLRAADARLEVAAQNVANMSTPGYRRRSISFSEALGTSSASSSARTDFTAGDLKKTGVPLDIAILGDGAFALRSADGVVYTRNGQFRQDEDGRVVDSFGRFLQRDDGGDLVISQASAVEIHRDGVVTEGDAAVGRIAIVRFLDPDRVTASDGGGLQTAQDNIADHREAQVRQGFLESSNVSLGHEMVEVMQTLRSAGSSQKLLNLYDDLIGRAITTFGQSAS